MLKKRCAPDAARVAKGPCGGERINSATGADAVIALENLLAQVRRLRAQLPLVHAELGAEGKASAGYFERTPTAEAAAIGTPRYRFAIDPASAHDAHSAHGSVLNRAPGRRFVLDLMGYKEKQFLRRAMAALLN